VINESKHQGFYEITIKDKKTGEIKKEIIKNIITNEAVNALIDCFVDTTPDLKITYLAVGTDNTAVSVTDAILGAEIFRTEPSTDAVRVATGQVNTEFILLDSEAVTSIKEIGIFVGASATVTADTGTLLSRALWTKEKSSSEEIHIKRIDKIVGG